MLRIIALFERINPIDAMTIFFTVFEKSKARSGLKTVKQEIIQRRDVPMVK